MVARRRILLLLAVSTLLLSGTVGVAAPAGPADTVYHSLAGGSLVQDWSNTGLITASDDWSGGPSIAGFRGDGLTSATGVDPQTVLAADDPGVLDVNANQTNPNTFTTGGVAEFHVADPVVALQGSGTADAPYVQLYVNTTGVQNIQVSYTLRDIDGSSDDAVQPVALHYRVGAGGSFTNVPAAYVTDATTGPGLATLVTPVSVTLPAAADNQAQLQLRIMTTNAAGNDEWVGIDNISITGTPIAGDLAPSVAGTTPADGATNVAVNANITVTFNEAVDVAGAWYTIACGASGAHTAAVSGGPTTFTLDPTTDFVVGETCTVTVVAAQVTDQDTDDPPDAMAADYVWSFATVTAGNNCGDPADLIHNLQGSGATSPVAGQVKSIEGIVVGDYQSSTNQLGGYFVQEEDADADGDAATSEGIFVYYPGGADVAVGDKVRVTGTVTEYIPTGFTQSLTELNNVTLQLVCSSGHSLTAAPVNLPLASPTDWESTEGMVVSIAQELTVTDNYDLGRYGQVTLSQGGKLWQFTHLNAPGVAGYNAHLADIALRTVILDDASTVQNPDPIVYPDPGLSALNTLRVGDTLAAGFTAVLDHRFDAYRLQPLGVVNFVHANPRPSTPAPTGDIQVGSFNTLNFFVTLDTGGAPCGPTGGQACRGANNATEFTRQRDKLVQAICGLDADVLGLMELENPNPANDPEPADGIADYVLKDLAGALNAAGSPCPDKSYTFTDGTAAGVDAIRVGIIYKASSVTPAGSPATLTAAAFTDPNGTNSQRNRPALAQTFDVGSQRFTVVVNHLKSKGSCPASGPDADQGDGQGCWNDTRTKAMAYLVNTWLPTDPTGSGDPDYWVMGDLNAYAREDPIEAATGAGYANVPRELLGDTAYSYTFDGQLGYLDHALSAPSLTPQVAGVVEWHINADEPRSLDYNLEFKSPGQQSSLYQADAYRSSDHDPVLVALCTNLALPSEVTIAVNSGADGVDIGWTPAVPGVAHWVWRSAEPYFAPSGPPLAGRLGSTTYTDGGVLSAVDALYYTVTACGLPTNSAALSRVGKFTFALTPGN